MNLIYQNQLISRRFLAKIACLLIFISVSASPTFAQECDATVSQLGGSRTTFIEVRHDFPEVGQSTWYYTVKAIGCARVRNVMFPINKECVNVIDAGVYRQNGDKLYSGYGRPRMGTDCYTGIYGLKFKRSIYPGRTRRYYFTLDKNLTVDLLNRFTARYRCWIYCGEICGPSAECEEVEEEVVEEVPLESCISGQVFHDVNINGIRDAGEEPLVGVQITLYGTSSAVGLAVTDAEGKYSFCELEPENYTIRMHASFEYLGTEPNVGSDEFDSDLTQGEFTDFLPIDTLGDSHVNVDGGYFTLVDFDLATFTVATNPNQNSPEFDFEEGGSGNDDDGETTTYDDMDVTVDNIIDVLDMDNFGNGNDEDGVQVYPNPIINQATFVAPADGKTKVVIQIRTQSGQLMLTTVMGKNDTKKTMDMSRLPNGTYFVSFISETGTSVEKVVKAN